MALESLGANDFIYTTLANDTLLEGLVTGVYVDFAPLLDPVTQEPPVYPFITFTLSSAKDVVIPGPFRLESILRYAIQVVGKDTSYAPLGPAFARIDALLSPSEPTIHLADGVPYAMNAVFRDGEIQRQETVDATVFTYLGGYYVLQVSANQE